MSNSKIVSKTYFIGDLINLVTDLGGTLKDSEQIWKEFINLLRKENVLNEKFDLNTENSKDEINSGFKKAAEFLFVMLYLKAQLKSQPLTQFF